MFSHSIEPYFVGIAIPTMAVLAGMGWYKLTNRRNRPFEPTLWFVFRWGFILLLLLELTLADVDALVAFHHSHTLLFWLATVVILFAVFASALVDWRRAVRKDREYAERLRFKQEAEANDRLDSGDM